MSDPANVNRWLAREMIAGAKSAARHGDLEDSNDKAHHVLGWLMANLTDAECATVRELLYGTPRAKPITSVEDERVRGG